MSELRDKMADKYIAEPMNRAFCEGWDACEANRWQPIETAPKDGTLVDLFGIGDGFIENKRIADCYYIKAKKMWQCMHVEIYFPSRYVLTHWKPISEGPKDE